jgi:hypothetical protein
MDIFAQRQDFWIARPTLEVIDQEQSLATVHHCYCRFSGGSIASDGAQRATGRGGTRRNGIKAATRRL